LRDTSAKNVDLYSEYEKLTKAVKDSLIEKKMNQFYTISYLKEVDLKDEKSLFLLNLPNYMGKVIWGKLNRIIKK